MHLKTQLVNWSQNLLHTKPAQQLFKLFDQSTDQISQFWHTLRSTKYSWNLSGLEQVQSFLQFCAKHNEKIAIQLKKLGQVSSKRLIPIFKDPAFLKLLTSKMQLSPQATQKIHTLLNRFAGNNSKIEPTKLLIIVLFIALGVKVPLVLEDSVNFKNIALAVTTVLDYVTTAIQLAQAFSHKKSKN